MKVAFQGVRGAYSETALRRRLGPAAEPVGFAFSEQVFDAVESGAVDAGFLPVENSIAGPVGVNSDLLLSRPVHAFAESYLPVAHCLLGRPGARLEDVREVRSHPVALEQCRDFLRSRSLRAVPEYDTAGAAELLAREGRPGQAAIASRECAEIYGLVLLAEGVQSARANFTRFLAIRRGEPAPEPGASKTSLAFAVRHEPGALLDALRVFAERRINLSRLESRPIPEDPFQYVFFVDLLGGADAPDVRAALDALRARARRFKLLGSYAAAERPD